MAVKFVGTGALTRTSSVPDDVAYTITAWIRPGSVAGSVQAFLGISDAADATYLALGIDTTSLVGIFDAGTEFTILTGVNTTTDYFVALTSSGLTSTTTTGYVRKPGANTMTAVSIGAARGAFVPANLWIGETATGLAPWSGTIWDVKVWDRALTATEILKQSYQSKPIDYNKLNSWYPLLDSNLMKFDKSPNRRDLTSAGTIITAFGQPYPQIKRPAHDVLYIASTGITGTLAQTLGALTLSSTGGLLVQGQLAQTLANVLLSSTGILPVAGSLAQTLGAVTVVGVSQLGIAGQLIQTLGPLTLVSSNTSATVLVHRTRRGLFLTPMFGRRRSH